jgi:hypothetical protein
MDIVQDGFQFFRHDLNEATYEQIVSDIFKKFAHDEWLICFEKVYLETAGRQVSPDGYLIKSDLSRVFFVEVEIEGHNSFRDHILPQVISYGQTNFSEKSAETLVSKWPDPKPPGLAAALLHVPAEVLLICTNIPAAWHRQLANQGAHWIEISPMRSEVGRSIRVLEGFFEFLLNHTLRPDVRLDPSEMHGFPVLSVSAGWKSLQDHKEITLIIDGRETVWTPQVEQKQGFLMGHARIVSELDLAQESLVGTFISQSQIMCVKEAPR